MRLPPSRREALGVTARAARLYESFLWSARGAAPVSWRTASVAPPGAPFGHDPGVLDALVLAAAVAPAAHASRLALLLVDLDGVKLVSPGRVTVCLIRNYLSNHPS